MARRLKPLGAQRLVIGGLATDYCVLETVCDALALGLRVVVLTDAIRAVDARSGDGAAAIEKMVAAGALLLTSQNLQPAPIPH